MKGFMPFFVVTRSNGQRDGLIELITEGFQRKTIRGYIAMTSLPKYKSYKNEDFYTSGGKFMTEVAKNAYYEMMEFFKYPISERLRGEEF